MKFLNEMEFDNICTAIQGRLHSAQKSLNSKFVDIIKDQNEDSTEALSLIQNAIRDLNLSIHDCRRVHLLFLLNTSFYSCTYIENDRNYCHIIGCIPKLSEYLYFKLLIQFEWHHFLGETILYCPEILTVDILKYIEANLKLLNPRIAVSFVYSLYENLFKKIIITKCKQRRQKIVKYLLNLLRFDFEEIVELMDCEKDEKYQYWGYVNRMYLELIEFCIRFMAAPELDLKPEVYDFTIEYDYRNWPDSTSEPNWGRHCIGVIATKTAESVRKVSVNMYMSWCEVDVPGSVTGKTLQTSVREAAYTCREAVKSISDLYDSVTGLRVLDKTLETMAVRPITEDEEVAAADPSTLVINILNPKRTQVKWLRGLIDRGVFESAPHMKVVIDNARLVDLETCQLLLNKAVQYISSNSIAQTDFILIRETVFNCIRALSSGDQKKLLEKFLTTYGASSVLISANFETTVVSLLNNVVSDSNRSQEVHNDVLSLAFENPEGFLSLCLRECLTSKQKSDLIIEMLEYVKPIFFTNHGGVLLGLSQLAIFIQKVGEQNVDQHRDICLHTVKALCQKSLVDGKKLLTNYIVPAFESSISEKELPSMAFLEEIITGVSETINYSSLPLVALIAKTLNRFRPRVTSFNLKAANFTTSCSKLLTSLVQRFLQDKQDEEDNEVKWLRGVANCLSPLTGRYMTLLWTKWGKNPPFNREDPNVYWTLFGLGKGLLLTSLDAQQRFTIVSAIVKVLPQLTMSEWEVIGCGEVPEDKTQLITITLALFFILADCVLILFQLPFMTAKPSCLGYILTNFMYYTQMHVLSILKNLNEEQKTGIQNKIEQISHQLPEQLIKSKMPQLVLLQKSISNSEMFNTKLTEMFNSCSSVN